MPMSTRRSGKPQAFSPLSPKASYDLGSQRTHERAAMAYPAQVETQNTDDTVSLTSLESGADDFDRRMIQTAREQRRLDNARTPKIHAFSKARIHPRVGVTLENLERHNAKDNAARGPNAHARFNNSPPSSSGSTRSDPALNVPSGWGRKGRVKRDWMRTITAEASSGANAPDSDDTPPRNADVPRQSVEDSPLSHKSFSHGTPASQRRRSIDDWTFDLNEVSLIASTPYRPRNTVLDDIRQREMEALEEQGMAADRLDRIREGSPEGKRRPRSASSKSANDQAADMNPGAVSPSQTTSGVRPHRRTNSWQAVGKAPAVTGESTGVTPIIVNKKSSETIGTVDKQLLANQATPARRLPNRRDDSHDLLRRLARASSTPSPGPGRTEALRPQSSSARQFGNSSQTAVNDTSPLNPTSLREIPSAEQEDRPGSSYRRPAAGFNATPMPPERSILNPKTPVVTGAWVDTIIETPGPSTDQRSTRPSQSSSLRNRSPAKKSTEKSQPESPEEEQEQPVPAVTKPDLPRSVLDAIVEEARANGGGRYSIDYGESTINSLEELITPMRGTPEPGAPDEDTIGLDIPTAAPRNEAERRRQEELLHIQQMDQKLRSTRTSLRDTSRGIRRVEEQIERGGEQAKGQPDAGDLQTTSGKTVRHLYTCPCAESGHTQASLGKSIKLLFYDSSLKPKRRGWGLTWLSIILLTLLAWYLAENICCEIWGHRMYARSYEGYGVVWGAPEYPYVLPTMTYRAFVKPWWRPVYACLNWVWRAVVGGFDGEGVVYGSARTTAGKIAERILVRERAGVVVEEEGAGVLGMAGDELVR